MVLFKNDGEEVQIRGKCYGR